MIASRRSFLTGLGALIAAPAIVRVASIMPVKAIEPHRFVVRTSIPAQAWRQFGRSPAMDAWLVEWGEDIYYRTFCHGDGSISTEVIRHPGMRDPSQLPRAIDTSAVWRGLPGGQQHA